MKEKLTKAQKGFTIIEVLIVLAIAGLIMVIVFFAVPQLQRNQRDNARQNSVNRVNAEMETYAANNQGRYPFLANPGACNTAGGVADFQCRYINNINLNNPQTGNAYAITGAANAASTPTADQIMIYPGMRCNGEGVDTGAGAPAYVAFGATNNSKLYATRVLLDRANTLYCLDNS